MILMTQNVLLQGTQSGVWCLDLIRLFLEDKLINVFSLILIASQILNKQFVRVLFICYQSFTDLDLLQVRPVC